MPRVERIPIASALDSAAGAVQALKAMVGPSRYDPLDDAIVEECASPLQPPERLRLVSAPLLAALARAGTEHVYVDTAGVDELAAVAVTDAGVLTEIDGNTVNQPLVRRVLARYTSGGAVSACAAKLLEGTIRRRQRPSRFASSGAAPTVLM
jgi:hypothetical protein